MVKNQSNFFYLLWGWAGVCTTSVVKTLLLATSQKPEVKIDWRIYTKNPDKPLIRDLIVEGLSLARTQKEEFASVIESNGGDVNKLFLKLEEFIAQ